MNLRKHVPIKYMSHGREDRLIELINKRVDKITEINKRHYMNIELFATLSWI